MMEQGTNFPWDAGPPGDAHASVAPEATWHALEAQQPDCLVMPSHAAHSDYERALDRWPELQIFIRAKTGPRNCGSWPWHIATWQEWPDSGAMTLGDAIELCLLKGRRPRVVLGNEGDIELAREPVDEAGNVREAIAFYDDWFRQELHELRQLFPETSYACMPLSQGSPERSRAWLPKLRQWWQLSDFVPEHCYTFGQEPFETLSDTAARFVQTWQMVAALQREDGKERPVDLLEANDDGRLEGDPGRLDHLARYGAWAASTGLLRSFCWFTVAGSVADPRNPAWWTLAPSSLAVLRETIASVHPIPAIQGGGMHLLDARTAAARLRWNLLAKKLPWHDGQGIERGFELYPEVGSPIADRIYCDDGSVLLPCTNGYLVWKPGMPAAEPWVPAA